MVRGAVAGEPVSPLAGPSVVVNSGILPDIRQNTLMTVWGLSRHRRAPSISMSTLARLRFFSRSLPASLGFRSHSIEYVVFNQDNHNLTIVHRSRDGDYVWQDIFVMENYSSSVGGRVFLCPMTGHLCRKLVLLNNRWASRQGHGLSYVSSNDTTRRREKLLRLRDDALRAFQQPGVHASTRRRQLRRILPLLVRRDFLIPFPLLPLEDVMVAASQERARDARQRARAEHRQQVDLKEAVENGCDAAGSVELGFHLTQQGWNSLGPTIEAVSQTARSIGRQNEHLCLDLAFIRSRGWLVEGEGHAWIMDWGGSHEGADRCLLMVELIGTRRTICLNFQNEHGHRVASQQLQLAERPGMPKRLFLVCPIRKSLHDRLYYRDGFFASAAAQRLKSASQRRAG